MSWATKLRVEVAALNEIVRGMTDDELQLVSDRIERDETAHLKPEALAILKRHIQARAIGRNIST